MERISIVLILLFLLTPAYSAELTPPTAQISAASTQVTVPTMANTPGALGGIFKTKVVVFNPSVFSFPIQVTLYDINGLVNQKIINMSAGQIRNYENFLEDVFAYSGAGAVNFDSLTIPGGNTNYRFLVNSEVYIDGPSGRFKTVVMTGTPLDPVTPGVNAYSTGITQDSSNRVNIGCFNVSSLANIVVAEVYDSSNQLIKTVSITLSGGSWSQVPLGTSVTGGYISWRPSTNAYCYAVVVNNTSNDGSFIPAANYNP